MELLRVEGPFSAEPLEVLKVFALHRGELALEAVMGPKDSQKVSTLLASAVSAKSLARGREGTQRQPDSLWDLNLDISALREGRDFLTLYWSQAPPTQRP